MKCEVCGKTPQFGSNVSHSKRHTNRSWKPNIHPVTLVENGRQVKKKLCTRCLRSRNKASRTA